jgi:hypothetical protein
MVTQNQALIASTIGFIAVAVVIVALLVYSVSISGFGTIRTINVKVYGDSALTKEITSVDWGTLNPGGSSVSTWYVKSTSSVPINLTITTSGWSPAIAESFMTCTWNYTGINLPPGTVAITDVTLRVSQNITGITNFGFTMIVTGTG